MPNSIRKQFFALRNGIIADTLRKGGLKQKYIFGLQLPQIKAMAEEYRPEDPEAAAMMARELWEDRECRESRLLACHLMPPSLISKEEATEWAKDVTTREEADILAFRLLRYLDFVPEIAEKCEASDSEMLEYMAVAIKRFL